MQSEKNKMTRIKFRDSETKELYLIDSSMAEEFQENYEYPERLAIEE